MSARPNPTLRRPTKRERTEAARVLNLEIAAMRAIAAQTVVASAGGTSPVERRADRLALAAAWLEGGDG